VVILDYSERTVALGKSKSDVQVECHIDAATLIFPPGSSTRLDLSYFESIVNAAGDTSSSGAIGSNVLQKVCGSNIDSSLKIVYLVNKSMPYRLSTIKKSECCRRNNVLLCFSRVHILESVLLRGNQKPFRVTYLILHIFQVPGYQA
jgi:hypothetical protein